MIDKTKILTAGAIVNGTYYKGTININDKYMRLNDIVELIDTLGEMWIRCGDPTVCINGKDMDYHEFIGELISRLNNIGRDNGNT